MTPIYAVEDQLARHQAATDRAEAREDAKEALIREEQGKLTETVEGVDELLAWILDRPQSSLFKQGFLEVFVKVLGKQVSMPISMDEITLRAALKSAAEIMAESTAADKLREIEKENQAAHCGW